MTVTKKDEPTAQLSASDVLWARDFGRSERDDELAKLRQAVAFFASVIKSGEPWTDECAKILRAALDWPK